MKKIIKVFIGLFLLSVVSFVYGEDLREDKSYPIDDFRAYAPYDFNKNHDIVKKIYKSPRSYLVGEHVWVYTKEFAKRFGMPSRWIGGKDFKGALALAYHKKIENITWCGYGGDWDNCRKIDDTCLLDVYVPHDSKTIPWNTDAQAGRIYSTGGHSIRSLKFFRNKKYEKDKYQDENGNLPNWYYEGPEGETDWQNLMGASNNSKVGIDSVSTAYRFNRDGFGEGGATTRRVREFHRNVLEGIDLITIQGICRFAKTGDGEAQIKFNEDINNSKKNKEKLAYNNAILKKYNKKTGRHKNFRSDHKIYPGLDFMQRVKTYTKENEGNSFFEFFKKNIKKGKK